MKAGTICLPSVVGCEPATLADLKDGRMELSEPLQTAVAGAIGMIESLIEQVQEAGQK